MKSIRSIPQLLVALTLVWSAEPAFALQAGSPSGELGKTLSKAEAQHEIVMLHIRKKEYDKARVEAAKIFQMPWPVDKEPLLLKELLLLSEQFVRNEQPACGLKLLDENVKAFRTTESQVAIWKEKGYIYKILKENDKALDCFREARRLEK
jgi:tetratricopeptide (TPR) repeat protein